jgi:hypothetical protein
MTLGEQAGGVGDWRLGIEVVEGCGLKVGVGDFAGRGVGGIFEGVAETWGIANPAGVAAGRSFAVQAISPSVRTSPGSSFQIKRIRYSV